MITDKTRLAPPPPETDRYKSESLNVIEVRFGIPVFLTPEQNRKLHDLIDEIVESPCNQLVNGVHWVSTVWPSGERFVVETTARDFVTDRERDKILRRRKFEERE